MINKITLTNFRTHSEFTHHFKTKWCVFSGWNWVGKTNILEAISLWINAHSFETAKLDYCINYTTNLDFFVIQISILKDFLNENYLLSYEIKNNKSAKKLSLNSKKITNKDYNNKVNHIAIIFSPLSMNILYLMPSLRRKFIDSLVTLASYEFNEITKNYNKILLSRNALLKNIRLEKATKQDLEFWNDSFAKMATLYVRSRRKITDFFQSNINYLEELLQNKYTLKFNYISKIPEKDEVIFIKKYLKDNLDRDILTWRTYIWPHLDDFNILVKIKDNYIESENFLSRWENKILLIWLYLLQIKFLETFKESEIILLFDDFFAELDEEHILLLYNNLKDYQVVITTQDKFKIPKFLINKEVDICEI